MLPTTPGITNYSGFLSCHLRDRKKKKKKPAKGFLSKINGPLKCENSASGHSPSMTQVCVIVDSWSTAIPGDRGKTHRVKQTCKKGCHVLSHNQHIIMSFCKEENKSNRFGGAYPGLYDPRITEFSAKSMKRWDYPRVFTGAAGVLYHSLNACT